MFWSNLRFDASEDVCLVTANDSSYWMSRYEGVLNGIANAVVLLCWPKQAFDEPKALHAFYCTDISLEIETIATYYAKRWPIEIFFRQSKNNLGFDTYGSVYPLMGAFGLDTSVLHGRSGTTQPFW